MGQQLKSWPAYLPVRYGLGPRLAVTQAHVCGGPEPTRPAPKGRVSSARAGRPSCSAR